MSRALRNATGTTPRSPRRNDPRDLVKQGFVNFAILVLVLAVMVFLTYVMRGIMSWVGVAAVVGIPKTIAEIYRDPWLIVAFILAVLFVWSRPWEDFLGFFSGSGDDNVRRGSRLGRWGRRYTDND